MRFALLDQCLTVANLRITDSSLRLRSFDIFAGNCDGRLRFLENGLGNKSFFNQQLIAFQISLRLGERNLRPRHLSLQRGDISALRERRGTSGFEIGQRLIDTQRK